MVVTLMAVAVLTSAATVYDQRQAEAKARKEIDEANRRYENININLTEIKVLVTRNAGYSDSHAASITTLEALQSLAASVDATALINNLLHSPSKPRIVFYEHLREETNPEIVIARLRQIGSTVDQRDAKSVVGGIPTNVIWVGDEVSDNEARAVALILTAAGVHLRDMRKLKNAAGQKARLIEIGSSARVLNLPVLTPDQIMRLAPRPPSDPIY